MTLRKWIDTKGMGEVAKALKVPRTTVYSWRRMVALPRPETMMRIVKVSKGKVSYENMITDFVRTFKHINN